MKELDDFFNITLEPLDAPGTVDAPPGPERVGPELKQGLANVLSRALHVAGTPDWLASSRKLQRD